MEVDSEQDLNNGSPMPASPADNKSQDAAANSPIEQDSSIEGDSGSRLASPALREPQRDDAMNDDQLPTSNHSKDPQSPPDQPMPARPDSATRLNELEATLRQPDAVMEPTILNSLRDYVVANGHPQHAVELLTEHYVGYPQMATLACGWLKFLDLQCGADDAADTTPSKTSAGVRQQHHLGAADQENQVPLSAMDEAYFLRQLVLEKFDPQRFAGIFSAGGSGAPQWLNGLISDIDGRNLIYDLSAKYQNSLLLNFAMQKILMQPGRDAEAVALGVSQVGFFGVFHRLFGVRLRQAAAANDEQQLRKISQELCEGAAQSQHAYVHAQQMLHELAVDPTQPWAPRFKRLSQELEMAVKGPVAWKMHRWFEAEAAVPSSSAQEGNADKEMHDELEKSGVMKQNGGVHQNEAAASSAAWLVADILASTSGGSPAATSDVIKLYRLYCPQKSNINDDEAPKQVSEAQKPSIGLLRQPRFIEALLNAVFAPAKQLQAEPQAAFVGLLALAVAADDDSPTGVESPSPLEQPAVIEARKSLEIAAELAHKALRDEILSEEERKNAEDAVKEPCCAAGILSMLRSRLTSQEYWAAAYHIHKEPPFYPLLLAIVRQQHRQHSNILSLISAALGSMGSAPSGPDVARTLLQVAVALVVEGRVDLVLDWVESWARNADAGLVRHFLFGLLEIAAPPYSPRFAASLVRLAVTGGALRQRMGSRDWFAKGALLLEFSTACSAPGVTFEPPLGRDGELYLRELSLALKNSGFKVPEK